MKRDLRKELKIGILVYAAALLLKQFFNVPEIIAGALLGFAICFELIGILPESRYQKLKAFKRKIFRF